MDAISSRLSSLDHLDALVKDVSQVSAEVKRVKEDIKTVSQEVNRIESKVETHDKVISELPAKVREEIQYQIKEYTYVMEYDVMIGKAYQKYLNLIVDGIAEDPPKIRAVREEKLVGKISTFCTNILGVSDIVFDSVYRLGTPRPTSKIPRPVLFRLTTQGDREAILKARSLLRTKENRNYRLREDMPDKLRDNLSILLRVLHHVRLSPELYHQPKVYDFRLYLDGKPYFADDLELPTYALPTSPPQGKTT